MSLTVSDKKSVEDGRNVVDTYRTDHDARKADNIIYGELIKGLNAQGYTTTEKEHPSDAIGKFFNNSDLYNLEELGFDDKEDFRANATKEDIEKLEKMWR